MGRFACAPASSTTAAPSRTSTSWSRTSNKSAKRCIGMTRHPYKGRSLMSSAHNKALIGRYYEKLWNRWDFALVNEIIGEAIVFRGSLGASVEGRKGFVNYMGTVQRAFPDFHNRIEELIAENDRVATRLTYSGTHRGEVLGIAPTG